MYVLSDHEKPQMNLARIELNSRQECILVGCVPPAAVAVYLGGGSASVHRCGPGTPPRPDPSTSPLGVGLETCKACWDTTPWRPARHAWILPAMHAGIPPPPFWTE